MDKAVDTLLEIQKIEDQILEHLTSIESQNNRIKHIEKQREDKNHILNEATANLKLQKELLANEEKELYEIDKTLDKANINLQNATNETQANASQKTIDSLGPKKEKSEDIILELMDKIELLEHKIKEANTFIEGSFTSLQTITHEVELEVAAENSKILKLEENINNLLSLLNKSDIDLYKLTNKNFKYKSFIVRIKNNACPKCGTAVDNIMLDKIIKKEGIVICSSCGRFLADKLL